MGFKEELNDIVVNLYDTKLLEHSLKIYELISYLDSIDDNVSEILFVSSIELLDKINTNNDHYRASKEQINVLKKIIKKIELSFIEDID